MIDHAPPLAARHFHARGAPARAQGVGDRRPGAPGVHGRVGGHRSHLAHDRPALELRVAPAPAPRIVDLLRGGARQLEAPLLPPAHLQAAPHVRERLGDDAPGRRAERRVVGEVAAIEVVQVGGARLAGVEARSVDERVAQADRRTPQAVLTRLVERAQLALLVVLEPVEPEPRADVLRRLDQPRGMRPLDLVRAHDQPPRVRRHDRRQHRAGPGFEHRSIRGFAAVPVAREIPRRHHRLGLEPAERLRDVLEARAALDDLEHAVGAPFESALPGAQPLGVARDRIAQLLLDDEHAQHRAVGALHFGRVLCVVGQDVRLARLRISTLEIDTPQGQVLEARALEPAHRARPQLALVGAMACDHRVAELAHREALARLLERGLELQRLGALHGLELGLVEDPARVEERVAAQRVLGFAVAGHGALALGLEHEQAALDEPLENLAPDDGPHLGGDRAPGPAPVVGERLARAFLELGARNGHAADRGDRRIGGGGGLHLGGDRGRRPGRGPGEQQTRRARAPRRRADPARRGVGWLLTVVRALH